MKGELGEKSDLDNFSSKGPTRDKFFTSRFFFYKSQLIVPFCPIDVFFLPPWFVLPQYLDVG